MNIRANTDIKRVEPFRQNNKQHQVPREFQTIMQEALSQTTDGKELKISNHAQKRLDQRGFSGSAKNSMETAPNNEVM